MQDMISPSMLPYLQTILHAVGGCLLIALGLSFAWKFVQASFFGKVNYWGGLDHVHWMFNPITSFVTPLFVHTPAKETNLIKTRCAGWVHLLFGPFFFLLSLMLIVAGADYLGLDGTRLMNFALTGGRPDIPPAIVYTPPFGYKFPFIKRMRKTVFKLITKDIYEDKSKSANTLEQGGMDIKAYTGAKVDDEDDEDRAEAEAARQNAMKADQSKRKK